MSALTEKEEARTNALGVLHIVLIVLSVCGAGCVAYLPSAVSTNPVGTLYERPVDVVSGHSSEYYILGRVPQDIQDVIEKGRLG